VSALSHLAPGRQKFLVGRLVGHEAVEHCLAACKEEEEESVDAVRDEINHWTKQVLSERTSNESLTDYLHALEQVLPGRVHQMHAEVAQKVIAHLLDRIKAIDQGRRDAFQEAFQAVVGASVQLYHACRVPAEHNRLRFELLCQPSGATHDFATDVMTGGRTARRGSGLRAQVLLTGDSFRFAEARAIPYVLFHEVVVHVLAHPSAVESGGKFAEGWMDLVAKQLHDAVLENGSVPGVEPVGLPFPERTKAWGSAIHNARTDPETKRRVRRVQGRDAGEGVLRGIRGFAGDDALLIFWTLSVALNRSELSEDDRDELTEILSIGLRRTPEPALLAALRRFAGTYTDDPIGAAEAFARDVLTAA
jgi:hypothetical protein